MADRTPGPARARRALLLRVLRRSLSRQPRDTAWLVAWSTVQALPSLAAGWVVAKATGDFLVGRAEVRAGLAWLGVFGLTALAGALASRQTYLRVAALVEPLRDDLVQIIVTGALRRATRETGPADTGAVARITHQAEIVRDCFAGLLAVGLTFAFMVVSALAGLAMLVPAVLPLAIVPMAVSLLLFCALLPSLTARQRRSVLGEEAMAESAAAALAGLRDVIACGAEDQVAAELAGRVTAQAAALRAVARINMVRTLCLAVGGWLPLLLVLAQAPSLLRQGVAPAAVIGAVTYIGGILQSALYMLTRGVGGSGIRLAITLQRIVEASGPSLDPLGEGAANDVLPTPAAGLVSVPGADRADAEVLPTLAAGLASVPGADRADAEVCGPAGTSRVSLRGVSFAYGPHAEPVLRGLDLDVPDGDHLAIVGPSGIGKSTLAGLIAGLLRPTAGEVRLGGRPLAGIPEAGVPACRVLIPQEAYVFAGTLGENLRYLAPRAPAAQLDASVDAVGVRDLVTRLGGYGAELNPATLSAGECQLIALARAHLSPARLAILDEATCHLDPATAARAEGAFADRAGALIVIAHRISSALRAQRVLVLDGTRASVGDHASLLASSPLYRDLVGQWGADHHPATEPGPDGELASRV